MKLVFLPGLDGTGLLFRPVLRLLKDDFNTQVINYNDCQEQTYQTLTEHALSKLPSNENFILIAESFSGRIAFEIGLKKITHLKGIVFVATFLKNPRPFLLHFRKLLPLALLLKSHFPDRLTRRVLFTSSTSDELLTLFWKSISLVNPNQLQQRLAAIATLAQVEKSITLPCIYLQATQDNLIRNDNYQDFSQHSTDITLHPISGSHFLLQTAPAACAEIIRQFSESLKN